MEYKTMQEVFLTLLPMTVEDEGRREELLQLGLAPTYANAMCLAVLKKGSQGDVTAVRFVRDTLGEKPEEEGEYRQRDIRTLDLTKYTDRQLEDLADQLEQQEET